MQARSRLCQSMSINSFGLNWGIKIWKRKLLQYLDQPFSYIQKTPIKRKKGLHQKTRRKRRSKCFSLSTSLKLNKIWTFSHHHLKNPLQMWTMMILNCLNLSRTHREISLLGKSNKGISLSLLVTLLTLTPMRTIIWSSRGSCSKSKKMLNGTYGSKSIIKGFYKCSRGRLTRRIYLTRRGNKEKNLYRKMKRSTRSKGARLWLAKERR